MDLNPSRTAVIAVHMQHDIVIADGAFGGFFAAQAVERDVIGQPASCWRPPAGPARPSSTPALPGSPATRTWSPTRRCSAWSRSSVPWSRAAARREIVPQLTPQDGDVVLTAPAGRRLLGQPAGRHLALPRHRHRAVRRRGDQRLGGEHRPAGQRPGLPHHRRGRRVQRRRPRRPRRRRSPHSACWPRSQRRPRPSRHCPAWR